MHRLLFIATWIYATLLVLVLSLLEWRAESFWPFTILLFAPPQVFLAPAIALAIACIYFRHWRLSAVLAACALLVVFGYMGLRHRSSRPSAPGDLTLVTHNIGQGNRQQFYGFLDATKPEIILLQDAKNRGPEFQKRYPDSYVNSRGEFVCISRYLIQQAHVLPEPNWHGKPVMARYELSYHGHPLILYNVHLPTPRNQLSLFLGARAALAMFGEEELPGGKDTLHEWNAQRVELYHAAADVFAKESAPFLVAGDFNMPDHGSLYHRFCSGLTDSFATVGSGCGFTFPGGMGRVAGLLGPWLRIDYIFGGRGCWPVTCGPESGILSQHRAVVARISVKSPG